MNLLAKTSSLEKIQALAAEGERLYWHNLASVYKEKLAQLAQNDETPPAALVSAAKEVFDRAYGKVADKVVVEGNLSLKYISPEEVSLRLKNLTPTASTLYDPGTSSLPADSV